MGSLERKPNKIYNPFGYQYILSIYNLHILFCSEGATQHESTSPHGIKVAYHQINVGNCFLAMAAILGCFLLPC